MKLFLSSQSHSSSEISCAGCKSCIFTGSLDQALMGLHQPQMAALVLDDSLLRFALPRFLFFEENDPFFIRDNCCHLMLSLQMAKPPLGLNSTDSSRHQMPSSSFELISSSRDVLGKRGSISLHQGHGSSLMHFIRQKLLEPQPKQPNLHLG